MIITTINDFFKKCDGIYGSYGLTKILNCIKERIIFDSVALQTIEWLRVNKIKMRKVGGGCDGGKIYNQEE